MIYTGQYKQDKWLIEEYFKFKTNGYFIDLAAGDGIFISNTYLLEKELNWQGICIEANDKTFIELQKNRSVICDNNCILDDFSTIDFINAKKTTNWEHLLSGVNTFIPKHHNIMKESTVSKKTISLNTLLNKHNCPDYIDYVSLDVEGCELTILKHFFTNNTRKIKMWMIENSDEKNVIQLMTNNGYRHLGKLHIDNIFELID